MGFVARPTLRRFAVLLAGAFLAVAFSVAAFRGLQPPSSVVLQARALGEDATAQPNASRLARAATTYRGGPTTTTTGEIVDVRVSDALPVETSTPEGWAD